MDQNAWWEGLNERLGITLEFTPVQDYEAKMATVLAGGDIPDLVHIAAATPRLPDVLEAVFEDLSPYLSGDAALDYPNLANLPEYMWQTTAHKGAIRAVPPGNIVPRLLWISHQEVLDAVGADAAAAQDADGVVDLFMEVTDAKNDRFASGDPIRLEDLFTTMFGAPFEWRETDGKFIHMYETDEYLEGLEFAARLWKEKVLHPNTFAKFDGPLLFQGGQLVFYAWGGVGYRNVLSAGLPEFRMGVFAPPNASGGGQGSQRLATGTWDLCAIAKQDSPDRVRELLRVLDYLAAPFGSAEYLYLQFGTEGAHHTWDDELSTPVRTEAIGSERISVSALASTTYDLFDPGFADITKAVHAHYAEVIPDGQRDASATLYSETATKSMANLQRTTVDVAHKLIQGRGTAAEWDAAVKQFRSGGGDTIRGELEQAFAEAQGG